MAKAPQEHVDRLRIWMQFNDELMKIDPTNQKEWNSFKADWIDEENQDFQKIINELENDEGFCWEYYQSYFQQYISHIYMRIIWGYEILVKNACDPELDYLDYNKSIKTALQKFNSENNESKVD